MGTKWSGGRSSDELLGLEEALEVAHLPEARQAQDQRLRHRPPQHLSDDGSIDWYRLVDQSIALIEIY